MAAADAAARPAQFDRSSKARRGLIAKVHVAKKQLNLDDDDYRQIMLDEAGVMSAADADEAGLKAVVRRFEGLGFKPLPKKGLPRAAQSPMAKKARALWISLYHLGEVRNRSEKALEAFAQRQLKCERMAWADQSQAHKLIEALKAMAERGGWAQAGENGARLSVIALNEGLCEAILVKLRMAEDAPASWTLSDAAFRLCGVELGSGGPMTSENYAALAAQLGAKLRAAGGAS